MHRIALLAAGLLSFVLMTAACGGHDPGQQAGETLDPAVMETGMGMDDAADLDALGEPTDPAVDETEVDGDLAGAHDDAGKSAELEKKAES